MTSRTWRFVLTTALAVLVAACGTDAASSPATEPTSTSAASSPTPEATPTAPAPTPTPGVTPVGPLDPITVDPSAEPEAFLAALPADEVACAESAVGDRDRVAAIMSYSGSWGGGYFDPDAPEDPQAVVDCLGGESIKRILVGSVQRMAGDLSSETVACMGDYATPAALVSLFAISEPNIDGTRDMMNLMFCLNASERAAAESSGNDMFVDQRPGFIDSLECVVDSREGDGTSIFERMIVLESRSSDGWSSPFEDPEFLATYGRFLSIAADCGFMSDEDLPPGFSAAQTACMYEEAGVVFHAFLLASAVDRSAMPDLALLLPALEVCGVSQDQLGDIDPTGNEPTPAIIVATEGLPGLREFGLTLTEEQFQCIQANITPEESARMAGGWTFESIDLLVSVLEVHHEACNISLEAVFQ